MKNGRYIDRDGTNIWYLSDQLHREDGPAIEWVNGDKEWFLYGEKHREDGPAIENKDGTKEWYVNDQLHREDGPAVQLASGTTEWWLNGQELHEDEFNQWIMKKELNEKLHTTLKPKPTQKRMKI